MDRLTRTLLLVVAIAGFIVLVPFVGLFLHGLAVVVLPSIAVVTLAAFGILAAVAAAVTVGLLAKQSRQSQANRVAQVESQFAMSAETIEKARVLTLESERSGRRLAIQVGGTLVGIAEIANESTDALQRAIALSEQVANGASAMEEIQASVEALARQIGHQKELVDQSAAAVEEISASIESVANVARNKRDAAERLANLTDEGAETVTVSERLIGEVDVAVQNVTGMIRVINGIAAQTNLLAMNAAIEAAHAGDYGRGFAVVATEIRTLAESTSSNAGQISKTLKELSEKMTQAQIASERSGEAFRSIREEAQSVSSAFGEITLSTEELANGSGEIVDATEKLRGISGETSISAEEMRIGANEVTEILTATRDTASSTAEAMESIRDAARKVAEANGTISDQSVASNNRTGELLELFAFGSKATEQTGIETRQRIELANMVLDQMGWVSRIRSSLDEDGIVTEAEVQDEAHARLGRWLEDNPEAVIQHPETLSRLKTLHHGLHQAISEISRTTLREAGTSTPEQFRVVLERSREIAELLMSYDEAEIRWTPDLAVGVQTFDAQHQKLFALVNRVYQVMRSGSNKEQLSQVFDELLDYTVYHFAAEEKAFEQFDYEDTESHKQKHADLVRQATELRAQMEADKPLVAVEVMEFLRDWVTNHIFGADTRYAPYMKEHGFDRLLEAE